jgi:hypothetical protein
MLPFPSMKLSPHSTGLALGGLFGLVHAGWSVLIVIGLAQPLLDWVFRLHMIQPVYQVASFSLSMAAVLVVVTGLIGYALGYVFALLWNALHKA